jgi:hypothetical protein
MSNTWGELDPITYLYVQKYHTEIPFCNYYILIKIKLLQKIWKKVLKVTFF